MKQLEWWLSIFDNNTRGASARKVAGFIALVLAVVISARLTTTALLISVIVVWLTFALLCFGIVTAANLIALKLGKTNET